MRTRRKRRGGMFERFTRLFKAPEGAKKHFPKDTASKDIEQAIADMGKTLAGIATRLGTFDRETRENSLHSKNLFDRLDAVEKKLSELDKRQRHANKYAEEISKRVIEETDTKLDKINEFIAIIAQQSNRSLFDKFKDIFNEPDRSP